MSSALRPYIPPPRGAGTMFFLGGGQNVDMPSDCQNIGGPGISIPLRQKVGGQLPPSPPPGSRAPVPTPNREKNSRDREFHPGTVFSVKIEGAKTCVFLAARIDFYSLTMLSPNPSSTALAEAVEQGAGGASSPLPVRF